MRPCGFVEPFNPFVAVFGSVAFSAPLEYGHRFGGIMRKSNWIIYIVAILISAFLLWLWFWLGFDHVDAPLDLVLSIIWWVLVIVACIVIHRVEMKRRERMRTCFIAKNHVYNSEAGTATANNPDEAVEQIHDIIRDLEYGFDIKDMPEDGEGNTIQYDYVVRSKVFDVKREEDEDAGREEELEWEGEVAVAERPDDDPLPFQDRDELVQILRGLYASVEQPA